MFSAALPSVAEVASSRACNSLKVADEGLKLGAIHTP
jgi:hypothetical protein